MLQSRIALEAAVRLWSYAARLKKHERRGWKKLRLRRVESVADHSFAVALMALLEGERRNCDVATVVKLALIHDLEEAITGDLTPADKRTRGAGRVQRERRKAVEELIRALPVESRSSYRKLWTDLRLSRTEEARLVHNLDKVEMALQASDYAKTVGRNKVADFYRSAARETEDPFVRKIVSSIGR